MTTVNVSSTSGNDDAYHRIDGGIFNKDTTNLVVLNSAGSSYASAMRFLPTIPTGANISAATLSITPTTTANDDMLCTIHCEAINNSPDFASNGSITNRTRTTANTSWNATALGTSQVDSPDFASALQETVNLSGFDSNSAVTVILWPAASGSRYTDFYSRNAASAYAVLNVTYTAAPKIDENLRSYLIANAGVLAVLSNATDAGVVQQDTIAQGIGLDRIWYQRSNNKQDVLLGGSTGLRQTSFNIECMSDNITTCQDLADAVKIALNGHKGSFGNGTVQGCFVEDHSDDYVPRNNSADSGLHVAALDLTVFHSSA